MDYYHILNVRNDATLKEINTNYKRLSSRYHPDKNPNDKYSEEKMKKISEAYTVISDYNRRIDYDSKLVQSDNKPIVQFNIDKKNVLLTSIEKEKEYHLLLKNKSTRINENDVQNKDENNTETKLKKHTFF